MSTQVISTEAREQLREWIGDVALRLFLPPFEGAVCASRNWVNSPTTPRQLKRELQQIRNSLQKLIRSLNDSNLATGWRAAGAVATESDCVDELRQALIKRIADVDRAAALFAPSCTGTPKKHHRYLALDIRLALHEAGLAASGTRDGLYERILGLALREAGQNYSDERIHTIALEALRVWPRFLEWWSEAQRTTVTENRRTPARDVVKRWEGTFEAINVHRSASM